MREAKGYEKLAIEIERHVGNYTPSHWCEPIGKVMLPPLISEQAAREMSDAHLKGKLRPYLESLYSNPNLVDAFVSFFEKKDLSYLDQ